ncbi:MAG TPA: SAM-dependent methyltransferase [Acidimicrobiia bacterium]|nr:SAM-dependent methyltransferase [Acidimicrobiia bacterium]
MGKDWVEWHRQYDDASSDLSGRLSAVQQELVKSLVARREREQTVISLCAGQGDDVLGVLACTRPRLRLRARLIELDPVLAGIAQKRSHDWGLAGVEVLQADAGLTSSYEDFPPADFVLVCGVFGNIADRDVLRTIDTLPQLVAAEADVIWTRSRRKPDLTPSIRRHFVETGFIERAFIAPDQYGWSVGVNRFVGEPRILERGARIFTFVA